MNRLAQCFEHKFIKHVILKAYNFNLFIGIKLDTNFSLSDSLPTHLDGLLDWAEFRLALELHELLT